MNKQNSLNIIFAGTPDFAAQHLQFLLNSQHNVIAVYTQPDKPAGRGKKLQASPVKQLAEQHQIPVYQPKSLRKPEAQAELVALKADVMVVVAYGLILPQAVLNAPRLGHADLAQCFHRNLMRLALRNSAPDGQPEGDIFESSLIRKEVVVLKDERSLFSHVRNLPIGCLCKCQS